jgi:hypothetical protein
MAAFGAAAVPLANTQSEELVIVERRQNTRIIMSVPGTYMLADHRNGAGERRTFPCRAVNICPEAIALAAPVRGRIGERAFATVEHLGKFKGSVIRLLEGGFVMSIVATDAERVKLGAKISWFDQYKNFDVVDQRSDARFVPTNPKSRIVFANGRSEDCFVLDLSASGAAVSAQTVPEIGTVLALATIIARVVRLFDGGFAVQFIERQHPQHLEARVSLDAVTSYGMD